MTTTQDRLEIIKGLYKPIAQPQVETFDECFDDFEEWKLFDKSYKPRFSPYFITGQNIAGNLFKNVKATMQGEFRNRKHADETMQVGPFCSMRDGGSMAVHCNEWVMDCIKRHTIIIGGDRMSFEIVNHDNGHSLVIAQHGSIIGSVWLAYIRTDSIPKLTDQ